MEGFTHLIPYAAGHEIIRQGRRDLTLVRMTPDIVYDQMIGAGCARKLVFSWGGNPGVGIAAPLPRRGRAASWPAPLEIEEHSHAGMANRYAAGAAGLPFAVLRGYTGTDLPDAHADDQAVTCPFTGEELTAVPALNPDVAVIHAQRADRRGNVQMWGLVGVQKETRSRRHGARWSPSRRSSTSWSPAPAGRAAELGRHARRRGARQGAQPSYAQGYYDRDNDVYRAWDGVARDRETLPALARRRGPRQEGGSRGHRPRGVPTRS